MQGTSDVVKCKVFLLTLSRDARTWYGNHKRQSIPSFHELSKIQRSRKIGAGLQQSGCRHGIYIRTLIGKAQLVAVMERAEKYAIVKDIRVKDTQSTAKARKA
ncbi:hypothetical protein Q3G72_022304 [Acer saccharum]|nr:hypothetical protein Q3G72_022304 [Acer saccharum]